MKNEIYLNKKDFAFIKENVKIYNSKAEQNYIEKNIIISDGVKYQNFSIAKEKEEKTMRVDKSDNAKKQDIEALRVLLDEGVITQEEYKKKALEIIDRKE